MGRVTVLAMALLSTCLTCAVGTADDVPTSPPTAAPTRKFNFETDIVPILTKFGCNTSGCHGKAEGQNGFKLSVFGSDPEADYRALLMEGRGRRVFPASPDQSLLLKKMSGGVPHGGGIRIEPDRIEYAVLRDWLVAGARFGSPEDPQVVRIELAPREATLRMGESVQLRATAYWTDGRTTDVTGLASFQSNNESLVRVDGAGRVTSSDVPGSAAVMAGYLGHVDLFQALVPRSKTVDPYPALSQHNAIDRLVDERLRKLHIVPAPLASDAEYLRRVYLDVIGTLPAADEARRFLADPRADRREHLINELLERPEFAEYWALYWADLLRVDREVLGHKPAYEMYRWIRDSLATNKPLDQFAREVLTAEGPLADAPQGRLFQVVNQPGEAASTVSQVFLGVRIACAQCHHHPYDRWSQTDYFGMSAFFAPLQRRSTPQGDMLIADGNPVTRHPRTNVAIRAHALGQVEPTEDTEGDRRQVLASWLANPQNPWFARNLANRVWARMMGRGLVEPVDDFRATNPPSNPALLDALAEELIDHQFDLRALVRFIVASRTYQQSTATNDTNADDEQNYSRTLLKRLDAEVLMDAVSQTTGVPEKFEGQPTGVRATQLWDSRVDHYFLSLFGRPVRKTVCTCERNASPSVAQVLHLLNSERVHVKLTHESGLVARLVRSNADNRRMTDELYLTFFSRYPTDAERQAAERFLASTPNRREAAEDLAWSLLNSLEFVFNH